MAKLQPAGLVGKITSFLFPKKLEIQVRTEQCPDGTTELTPLYFIDGQEVEARFITPSAHQTILGYNVEADEQTLAVSRRGCTRVTKRKAAEYLKDMQQRGILVRSKGGRVPVVHSEVKPDITLTLNSDDSLDVTTTLATADGDVVEKPVSLEQLRNDDGWYLAGDNFVHVEATGTEFDDTLLASQGPAHLSGNSVPELLKHIDSSKGKLGDVEKSDNLKELGVYGETSEQKLWVDGDGRSIRVRPSLLLHGKNKSKHEVRPEDFSASTDASVSYRRIPEGWLEFDPKRLADYQQAASELRGELGDMEHIEGIRIPETLIRLLTLEQHRSQRSRAEGVADQEEENASVDFRSA